MSYLTQPVEELQREVIAALEGEGFAFNPLTTTFAQYLATCLGVANAYKTKSVTQMLAELNVQFGGSSVSRLTSSYVRLLDTLNTTIGGGGGGYVADAVHFDGTASLHIASLTSTDNKDLSYAGWFKLTGTLPAMAPSPIMWAIDPENSYNTVTQFPAENQPTPGSIQFADTSFGANIVDSGAEVVWDGAWHSVVASFKRVDGEDGLSNQFRIYVDRVDVTNVASTSDPNDTNFLSNGLSFWFCDDSYGDNPVGDFADWRIMPGVSLLTAGDITPATLDLFLTADNKPVDPAVATAGLGVVGAVLFSGNSAAFPVNQGTGGAFTLTGSLTNASTSPSD